MLKNLLSALFMFLFLSNASAQNSSLLLKQYRRGPALNSYYKKLNFELEVYAVKATIQQRKTISKFDYAYGGRIQYRFTKTFGLTTGIQNLNITYQYDEEEDKSVDRISYLSFPLSLRVFPGSGFNVEIGALFNHPLKATNTLVENDIVEISRYSETAFKNTLGVLFGVQVKIIPRINVAFQIRYTKRFAEPLGTQNNNTGGALLGLQYSIRNPNERKRVRLDLGIRRR